MDKAASTIGVLVADDHPVVRAGLVSLLTTAADIEILATACDGAEAVELGAEHHPDEVLMDLSMPKLCGADTTREMVAGAYNARVVIPAAFGNPGDIGAAHDAGAVGYLLK